MSTIKATLGVAFAFSMLPMGAEARDIVSITPTRIAFYEAATKSVAASMRSAVKQECKARNKSENSEDEAQGVEGSWLCDGLPLRFFRGVDVMGYEQWTGLVCASDDVTPNLRYYLEDMFDERSRCFFVAYSVKERRHFLSEPEASGSADNQKN